MAFTAGPSAGHLVSFRDRNSNPTNCHTSRPYACYRRMAILGDKAQRPLLARLQPVKQVRLGTAYRSIWKYERARTKFASRDIYPDNARLFIITT